MANIHTRDTAPFETFRGLFPAVKRAVPLSICDKMILADPVRAGVDRFMDKLALSTADRVQHEVLVESGREKFARLMNVAPENIAVMRNVSDGINALANALRLQPQDNVVIATGIEHPNNIYPWLRQRENGVELRDVACVQGRIDYDALMAACDENTRVLSVASVSFAPGYRTDVTRLAEFCNTRDIFLVVDGVQSCGVLHHDLSAEGVGAFATSTSKGLLALYGYGFMYVAPRWLSRLNPVYLSRTGVDVGNGDASAMGERHYTVHKDARRFELGSYNLAGAYAVDAALDLLLELGSKAVEDHVLALADILREGLVARGYSDVCMPEDDYERSHIVTMGKLDNGGHGFSHDDVITKLSVVLNENNIIHTVRRGQLRFGIHAYNNQADIDAVLALV